MDINKEREAFDEWHYNQYLLENPNIDTSSAKHIYDYAHKNVLVWQIRESHFTAWQAAKAQSEKALLEQFEINNKLVEQIEELKAKAQAVPEGFVFVSQKELLELAIAINAVDLATHTESKTNEVREMWQQVALKLGALCSTGANQ